MSKKELEWNLLGGTSQLTEIENCFLEITNEILNVEVSKRE